MLTLPAPAKLNLFLHITAQRADGYHELQTIFQFIDYCDNLHFTVTPHAAIELTSNLDADIAVTENIVYRAAHYLQENYQINQGVKIQLEKNIPTGAGLGGGSSDAATTLLALNQLWDLHLSNSELLTIGKTLGADVPIFLHGKAAWAEGIGEQFQDVELNEPWFVVIVPNCHVNTAKIFSDPELTRNQTYCTINDFKNGDTVNICEAIVKLQYPAVAEALAWLTQFKPARMTGTGCCVFISCVSFTEAQTILQQAATKDFQAFVAKGLNHSPLQKKLGFF